MNLILRLENLVLGASEAVSELLAVDSICGHALPSLVARFRRESNLYRANVRLGVRLQEMCL
jgi:hypothetical protein